MQRETKTERDRLKDRGRDQNQERMKGTETLRREEEGVLEPTRSSLNFPLPPGSVPPSLLLPALGQVLITYCVPGLGAEGTTPLTSPRW